MTNQKIIDDANRLKYVRALERFHRSVVGFLISSSELSMQSYKKKIDSLVTWLDKVTPAKLYKGDLQDLQKLVKKMIDSSSLDVDILTLKEELLYASNQLQKSKNSKKYKKDKHQNYRDLE